MPKKLQSALYQYILDADRNAANKLIEEWAADYGYERVLTEILEPVLQMISDKWEAPEGLSLAQAYIAGKVAEDIMEKLLKEREKLDIAPPQTKGPVVIGNIEDDYHSLGRKLVVIFLRTAGWEVYDLGNDVLPSDFVDKAVEVGAKIIGASAMLYTTAENIKKLRAEIDRRGLKDRIKLAVGGAVFILRPELVKEVGGDGTAKNAILAVDLIDKLWNNSTGGDK